MFTVTNIAVFLPVLLAFIAIAAWEDLEETAEAVGLEAVLAASLVSCPVDQPLNSSEA